MSYLLFTKLCKPFLPINAVAYQSQSHGDEGVDPAGILRQGRGYFILTLPMISLREKDALASNPLGTSRVRS